MILATGKMTKQLNLYQNQEKEYIFTVKFGATTPSYDADTNIDQVFPYEHITEELLTSALEKLKKQTWQIPPLYSAKRIKGKRAYEYARKGEEIELEPKKIIIKELNILEHNLPETATLKAIVSKGTYIRALARDLGKELNSGAYVIKLKRTRIGDFSLEDALTLEQFEELLKQTTF